MNITHLYYAAAVIFLWLLLCAWAWRQARRRRRVLQQAARALDAAAASDTWLIAYASQTGSAEHLARQSAAALQQAGRQVQLAELGQLDLTRLQHYRQALFIVSTYGEGDPPDHAAAFADHVMLALTSSPTPLAALQYSQLTLGDRQYTCYCGFGRRLDAWLQQQGAGALFETIEVDNNNPAALQRWQQQLAQLTEQDIQADWPTQNYMSWRLSSRQLLNPGSQGEPCFHLVLSPNDVPTPSWQAGDILEVAPRQTRSGQLQAQREYSIASLPADGSVHLLVRQTRRDDGSLGLGSGWLTQTAQLGDAIDARIRSNRNFHPPADARPLILIGNGTGLAGLRSLLKARIAAGQRRNWLLFGERNAASDWYFREEIEHWRQQGLLGYVDAVFSRDQAERRYVQHRLREQTARLQFWVEQGAAIYVCGSLRGMAEAVDSTLIQLLGATTLQDMRRTGRYRRDVY